MGKITLGITDPAHFPLLPRSRTSRIDRRRPWKLADVQAVLAESAALKRTFPDFNHVPAVGGNDRRAECVLLQQRGVVAAHQLETVGVQDRNERVEKGVVVGPHPQPYAFNLHRQPLTLLGLDGKVVHVLVLNHAVDRAAQRDLLGTGEGTVRLRLHHLGQRANTECLQVADAGGCADAQRMKTQRTGGGERQASFQLVGVDRLQFFHFQARPVQQQRLGIGQPRQPT